MAHYLISEASRRLHVEAHVLRYWEEELQLEIPRNELGHRYYTEKQLALFQRIKELKELGYQLKAIRTSLHEEQEAAEEAGFFVEDSGEDSMEGSGEDSRERGTSVHDPARTENRGQAASIGSIRLGTYG